MQSARHHVGCMEALPLRHGIFFSGAEKKLCGQAKKPASPPWRPQESQRKPTHGTGGSSGAMKSAIRASPSTRPPSPIPPPRAAHEEFPTSVSPGCSSSPYKKSPLYQLAKTNVRNQSPEVTHEATGVYPPPPHCQEKETHNENLQL